MRMNRMNVCGIADELKKAMPTLSNASDRGAFLVSVHQRQGWFKAVSAIVAAVELEGWPVSWTRLRFYEACGIGVVQEAEQSIRLGMAAAPQRNREPAPVSVDQPMNPRDWN